MVYERDEFRLARPVFAQGLDGMMNVTLMLKASAPGVCDAVFAAAGHCDYQIFVNGKFVFWGPARAGRDFYRIDRIPVGKYLTEKENDVTVFLYSYACHSYEYLDSPGFFCAELLCGDEVLIPTGGDGWKTYAYPEKVREVQRYSFQRTFAEYYDFSSMTGDRLSATGREEVQVKLCENKNFITREAALPDFPRVPFASFPASGRVERVIPEKYYRDRAVTDCPDNGVAGFKAEEIPFSICRHAEELSLLPHDRENLSLPYLAEKDSYITASLSCEKTGFINISVNCVTDCLLYLLFDELLDGEKVNFTRLDCLNAVVYKLRGGERYDLLTAEPYSLRYLNIVTWGGDAEITECGIVCTELSESEIIKELDGTKADGQIVEIYRAAVESFRQNTLDIFMDCPSRERAGWLCDSFFTSRVERLLTGKSRVEHSFLADFVMTDNFPYLPSGMLPMCYPADHNDGVFIPNWALWFVLELSEYEKRTGDREFVDGVRDRVYGLLSYFKKYENADGLPEKLDGWVFVEWSESNTLVQDINYPTAMLLYKVKKEAAALYGDSELAEEAERLRTVIRERSRMGLFFCDNSVYGEDGVPVLSGKCTECCQYYAFYTGVADADTDRELFEILMRDFGPERRKNNKWGNIAFANAFVGNYLRLELMCQSGRMAELEENIRGYFGYMARRTGTLWEHEGDFASCNHGFASHVLVWLDALGYLKDKE